MTNPYSTLTKPANGIALLRIAQGSLLSAHGLLKLLVFTPAGTAAFFESLGLPAFVGYLVIAAELLGGLALILGYKTRLVALALVPLMIGATFPHIANGWLFSNNGGGWEFPAFWTLTLIVQAILGSGAFSVDNAQLANQTATPATI